MRIKIAIYVIATFFNCTVFSYAKENEAQIKVSDLKEASIELKIMNSGPKRFDTTDPSYSATLEVWNGDRGYKLQSKDRGGDKVHFGGFQPIFRFTVFPNEPQTFKLNLNNFTSTDEEVAKVWEDLLSQAKEKQISLQVRFWIVFYKPNSDEEILIPSNLLTVGVGG